jgi:excisionase family DNA binding protein
MDPTRERTHEQSGDPARRATEQTADHKPELTTVTVADAAELLGLSTEAVRMRIKRGTLASTKIGGTVYVSLDGPDERPNAKPNAGASIRTNPRPNGEGAPLVANLQEHNADLRDRVEHLRRELDTRNEELRRKDTIIMVMTQRIPELEPTPKPWEKIERISVNMDNGVEAPSDEQEPARRRPWLYRFFFGP